MHPSLPIRAFRPVRAGLATAGQPTAEQFQLLRDAGFHAILNLALPTSDGAFPHEPQLARALGMEHHHIPVDFDHPADADVVAFMDWMERRRHQCVLVHCALNMRASAFVHLWRVLREGVPEAISARDLHAIWLPSGPWRVLLVRWLLPMRPSAPGSAPPGLRDRSAAGGSAAPGSGLDPLHSSAPPA